MKKLSVLILPFLFTFVLGGCITAAPPSTSKPPETTPPADDGFTISSLSEDLKTNLSADGYVRDNIIDFSQYENTSAYRTVRTADELITAIADAKYHYANIWDGDTETYTQIPAAGYTEETIAGKVHVIEIANDLNLGYYTLSDAAKASGIVDDFCTGKQYFVENLTMSDAFTENGISQIKVENTSNLLIFSKNGAKLTHCGFKLTSDDNVVFRNLEFDELWQWEDAPSATASSLALGDYDAFGWAYFKISFSGYIWIDHCTFGKSYDGQIDYSNPVYNTEGTSIRAPYGADGNNGLHISYCKFNGGSADEDGYIYKMMTAIENDYKNGGGNYMYYKTLRDAGASFEDILYGLAIPQKKGFLCGDDATYPKDDYIYNLNLQVSFANCTFKNLEDRIPKLRGGNAYMYNCIVDNLQYYSYRARLQALGAKTLITTQGSSNWKCALTSQCLLCGNGGSVMAENCVFKGVEYLLKNNDTKNTGEYLQGGYCLVNCTYQKSATDNVLTLNSAELSNESLINASASILKPEYFSWHTADGEQPFAPAAVALDALEESLNNSDYGAGVNTVIKEDFLKSSY